MKLSMLVVGALLAVAAAQSPAAPPAPQSPTAAPTSTQQGLALELAVLGQPRELLVEALLIGYDQAAKEGQSDEQTLALEKEFPGYLAMLRSRGREELANLMGEQAASLHEQLAAVYQANLTESHMREIISFLRTPTGTKLVRQMTLAPTGSGSADDMELTEKEIAAEARSAAAHAVKQLTADEFIEVVKFAATPAGLANRQLSSKIQPIVATFMTGIMTKFTERFEPIAIEVLQDYEKQKKPS